MKHYLLSIYQPDGDPPPADVLKQIMRDVRAVEHELQAQGHVKQRHPNVVPFWYEQADCRAPVGRPRGIRGRSRRQR